MSINNKSHLRHHIKYIESLISCANTKTQHTKPTKHTYTMRFKEERERETEKKRGIYSTHSIQIDREKYFAKLGKL